MKNRLVNIKICQCKKVTENFFFSGIKNWKENKRKIQEKITLERERERERETYFPVKNP